MSKIELENYSIEKMETVEDREDLDTEIQIIQNSLDFSDHRAREVMIPATEVVAVEVNTPLDELNKLFVEAGLSKILVYNNNIANLSGYVAAFELLKEPATIKAVLRPVVLVSEARLAQDAMNI